MKMMRSTIFLICLLVLFVFQTEAQENNKEVFFEVEDMPEF